jgi:hypothetical protein
LLYIYYISIFELVTVCHSDLYPAIFDFGNAPFQGGGLCDWLGGTWPQTALDPGKKPRASSAMLDF